MILKITTFEDTDTSSEVEFRSLRNEDLLSSKKGRARIRQGGIPGLGKHA